MRGIIYLCKIVYKQLGREKTAGHLNVKNETNKKFANFTVITGADRSGEMYHEGFTEMWENIIIIILEHSFQSCTQHQLCLISFE